MIAKMGWVVALFAVLGVSLPVSAATRRVDLSASTTGPGTTWANAYNNLTMALAACSGGDEVWVAGATGAGYIYKPGAANLSFNVAISIKIIGGYAGLANTGNDTPNPNLYITVLSGDFGATDTFTPVPHGLHVYGNTGNCDTILVFSTSGNDSTLQGFTIQGARDSAVRCESNTHPLIRECNFKHNVGARGGGIFVALGTSSSAPTVRNCTFTENQATFEGGGFYSAHRGIVLNCTFKDNRAGSTGGGATMQTSETIHVVSCRFDGNWAAYQGGGIAFPNDGTLRAVNSLFINNESEVGGALYIKGHDSGLLEIINCTLANNRAGLAGGGCFGPATIVNSIFWGNISDMDYLPQIGEGEVTVTYSDIEGGWTCHNIPDDCFNINANPNFDSEYRPQCQSACIGAGSNSAAQVDTYDVDEDANTSEKLDLEFKNRLNTSEAGSNVDMGAYEKYLDACYADVDNDDIVNVNDLLEVINNWGACSSPAFGCTGDVTGAPCPDGVVNVNDLIAVINTWGACPEYVGGLPNFNGAQSVLDCMDYCTEELELEPFSPAWYAAFNACVDHLCREELIPCD